MCFLSGEPEQQEPQYVAVGDEQTWVFVLDHQTEAVSARSCLSADAECSS